MASILNIAYIIHSINTTKDDQTGECSGISNDRTEVVSNDNKEDDKEDANVDEDNVDKLIIHPLPKNI